jgi:hypothetical protein
MLDTKVIAERIPEQSDQDVEPRAIARALERPARLDLYAIMTLLLLLLYPSNYWYVRIPITVLCVSAFVFRSLRLDPRFWFVVGMTVMAGNYQNWFAVDNHKYLLGYWCLALFSCLLTSEPEKSLAVIARRLVALSFLFAVFWKLASRDYLNGTFFHYSLLLDERFRGVSELLGGMTREMIDGNRAAYRALINFDSTIDAVHLLYTNGVTNLAKLVTWWTLFIEAAVTASFLWPKGKFISKGRDFILIVFILSTYSVAPVLGFGWTLIIMGLAQCEDRYRYIAWVYMSAFIALQVYNLPFRAILLADPR